MRGGSARVVAEVTPSREGVTSASHRLAGGELRMTSERAVARRR